MAWAKTALFLAAILCASARVGAQTDGIIDVRTDPEGIEVWLDDKYVGDSPILDKHLKPGRYSLKLVDPVQKTSTVEEIFVQPGEKTVIEKTIKSRFGSLRVDSDPPGADVSISTPLGKTPLANDFMNPGKYRVEIQHPNRRFEKVSEEVVIPRGEVVNVNKTLVRKSPLDTKALVRLGLGAGAVGGLVWAVFEQGEHVNYREKAQSHHDAALRDKADTAAAWRNVGVILSSVCVVGFEIVAFF